jgi:hypothetical protein
MSQTDKILEYLQKGNKITAMDALEKFRCFRLAARINDLKKKGHQIISEQVCHSNGKHYAQYKLIIPQEQLPLVDWDKFLTTPKK